MNADHAESTAAMVRHYLELPVSAARIIDLDRYGMNLQVGRTLHPIPYSDHATVRA